VIVGEPVQVPFVVVSVCPSCGVPEITGSAVFATGIAVTTELALLVAVWVPAVFVAVTTTRTRRPISLGVST
jgi:hypothetical protein